MQRPFISLIQTYIYVYTCIYVHINFYIYLYTKYEDKNGHFIFTYIHSFKRNWYREILLWRNSSGWTAQKRLETSLWRSKIRRWWDIKYHIDTRWALLIWMYEFIYANINHYVYIFIALYIHTYLYIVVSKNMYTCFYICV